MIESIRTIRNQLTGATKITRAEARARAQCPLKEVFTLISVWFNLCSDTGRSGHTRYTIMRNVIVLTALIFLAASIGTAQSMRVRNMSGRPLAMPPVELTKVLDSRRIKEARYKIVLYNQDEDQISKVNVLNRQISRATYESKSAIRITEAGIENGLSKMTTVFVDQLTLMPLYFEEKSSGTIVRKAYFDHGKEILILIENGVEKRSEAQLSVSIFLSNSFSELLQANDFRKNPAVRFQTVNPGNAANVFIAERFAEKDFMVSPNKLISCWVVKFTRIDSNGKETPTGFRYIDKISGKVLMFKSDLESRTFFTYQYLFLND
jgi:hypothetical protein